ncbi:hypothetical protein CCM_00567 [Cordyceps militaris CM01]|uniref:Uncharacterized protein n=1 Tax=Cordyceps militaris (strain CM01) TaxID=983644 RepID=G3J4U6_CORMM|nr:uncharacterized protein CCM_00567 [Cordyceps militaris CM01]EGX95913.1 hypothetical protein CCM_00567 [Cordyceps militaris CM01]
MTSHLTADCPLLLVACHPSANSEDQDMHPNTHQRPKHHQIRTTLAHRASADSCIPASGDQACLSLSERTAQRFRCFQQWHAPLSEVIGILVTYYCEHQLAADPGPQKSQHRLFHHCLWSPWQLLGFLVGKLACRTGDLSPYAGSVSSPGGSRGGGVGYRALGTVLQATEPPTVGPVGPHHCCQTLLAVVMAPTFLPHPQPTVSAYNYEVQSVRRPITTLSDNRARGILPKRSSTRQVGTPPQKTARHEREKGQYGLCQTCYHHSAAFCHRRVVPVTSGQVGLRQTRSVPPSGFCDVCPWDLRTPPYRRLCQPQLSTVTTHRPLETPDCGVAYHPGSSAAN